MRTTSNPVAYLEGDIAIDLTRDWADVLGNVWTWTGHRNQEGQPLMRSGFVDGALPLDVLYADHGPLIPLPVRPTAAVLRAGFESGAA